MHEWIVIVPVNDKVRNRSHLVTIALIHADLAEADITIQLDDSICFIERVMHLTIDCSWYESLIETKLSYL